MDSAEEVIFADQRKGSKLQQGSRYTCDGASVRTLFRAVTHVGADPERVEARYWGWRA
jgi:hypothetical protein